MSDTKTSCRKRAVWVIIALILLGTLALVGVYLVGRYAIGRLRADQAAPQVIIRDPLSGATYDPSTPIEVYAEAWGNSPVEELSLSVDGQRVEVRSNADPQAPIFHVRFEIELADGPHVIVVRAVDQAGLVGQSLPVTIIVDSTAELGPGLFQWTALAGEKLADIAEKLGFDPDGLDGVNPTLGDGPLPAGTVVQVPFNPGGPATPQGDVIFPDPIPVDTGSATYVEVILEPDLISQLIAMRTLYLPEAPSNTQAAYQNCSIILRWDDNSENEAYFNIWMSGLGHSARIIGTASPSSGTGTIWAQFDAPEIGFYSFWVESVNFIGSQPSEVAWVGVIHTDTCANVLGTTVRIELTDLAAPGGYDRFYCYVSANGFPAKRYPPKDGIFIQLGVPPFNIIIGDELSLSVPIPDPRTLTLSGECLGWVGSDLVNLGPFEKIVPESEWDGRELTIDGDNYQIKFTVLIPHPTTLSSMVQSKYDLTLPAPYDLRIDKTQSPGGEAQHTLSWRWDGDTESISGFSIFIDGVGLGFTQDMSLPLLIPDTCGLNIRFTVSALGMDAPSLPSAELTYTTAHCELNAIVEFISLNIYGEVDDDSDCFLGFFPAENCYSYGRTCDGYQAVGWLTAVGATYQKVDIGYWSGDVDLYWPVNCHGSGQFYPHSLAMMAEGQNVFTVPLIPEYPVLEFSAVFIDLDSGPNDVFCKLDSRDHDLPYRDLTWANWETFDETFELDCSQQTQATVVVRVRGIK